MKKTNKKKNKNIRGWVMFKFIVVIFFALVSFFASLLFSEKQYTKTAYFAVFPTTPPFPTLTPTPSPTPSPTPIPGYCLYVPVLMYHHIQPQKMAIEKKQTALSVDSGVFDQQMAYVASKYTTISAGQLVDALLYKTALAKNSIVLTFDDGYRDNFEYAHPIIQKYNLTAHLMLATGLAGGADYLSWDQIQQMAGSGRWQITNHTWSHYSLGKGNDEKIRYEVQTAQQQIQNNTGQVTDIFTYPYGTIAGVNILKSLGVRGSFSTIPGSLQCDSILYQLRRTRIGNSPLSSYGF